MGIFFTSSGQVQAATLISNCTELQNMKNNLADAYELASNIDCSASSTWNSGAGFIPIGTEFTPFRGQLDGKGKIINGLTIARPTENNVGLFGYMSTATIKNVGLKTVKVSGKDNVGGLVGYSATSVINDSHSTGSITGANKVGGLVGNNYVTPINNSYATVDVNGTDNIGGLVGKNGIDSPITNSRANGTIKGTNDVGGLAGFSSSHIETSYATGSVEGTNLRAGGLIGLFDMALINNSYATASVKGNSDVGGLVGKLNFGIITNSYANGKVIGSTLVGGLVGYDNGGTTTNSYYDQNTAAQSDWTGKGIPYTTTQMNTQSSFTSWDFASTWIMNAPNTDGYPKLRSNTEEINYQPIATCTDLQNMNANLFGYYALANDIDCSDSKNWNSGLGFDPIGDSTTHFQGIFNGKGYKIKHLTINRPNEEHVGLFASIYYGKVTLVGIENAHIIGKRYGGTLAGKSTYSTINLSYGTGKVVANDMVGGLVGRNEGGTIENSYANTHVEANLYNAYTTIGGLVAENVFAGIITKSYATGSIVDTKSSYYPQYGGVVGKMTSSTITSSYFDKETTKQNDTGKGSARTTIEMKKQTTFSSWDFSDVWIMDAPNTDGYPKLKNNIEEISYQLITTCTDLQNINTKLSGYYALANDIDCSDSKNWNSGLGFVPIGKNATKFTGIFNGADFTIKHLTVNRPTESYVGLFGFADNTIIKNVSLEDVQMTGKSLVGGLIGDTNQMKIENVSLEGNVQGGSTIGGLIGRLTNNSSTVNSHTNVQMKTAISGELVSTAGGLVGYSYDSTVTNSSSEGTIEGSGEIGGLIGKVGRNTAAFNKSNVSYSYSTMNVKGSSTYLGGLIANIANSDVLNSYSTGHIEGKDYIGGLFGYAYESSVTNSYTTGKITGTGASVRGISGSYNALTLKNTYFDKETTGRSETTMGVPYTTAQMKARTNFINWDFDTIWIMDAPSTDGYPKLRNNLEKMALDITPPVGILTLSQETWTKNSVIITALGTDAESGMKQIELPSGIMRVGDTATYTVSTNGTYTFAFEDMVGNITVKSIVVGNIDQTKPTVSFTLDIPAPTNQNITITANGLDVGGSGVMRIQKPDGTYESGATATYSVTANGTYAFTIEDNTGNSYTESITITTIDKLNPTGLLTADVVTPTNEKVTVTANGSDTGGSGFKHILKPDGSVANGTSTTYIVSTNGTYTFIFEDHAGNNVSQSITVNNIMVDLATKDPAAAYPFYQGKTFTIKEPGVMDATYTYLGILVSRKTPTTDNSLSAATYTKTYTHTDGKSEWFIPKSEAFNGEYALPYNEAVEYHKRLFSLVGTNYIYKLDVKHVYRLPDGRDIVGDTQSLYYVLDVIAPTGTLTQNPDTFTKGNVTITATGTDIGVSGFQRIQKPDGTYVGATNTTYVVSANGTYTFTFEDRAGNKSSKQITISNIDKAVPTVAFNPPSRDWANLPSSVGLTFTDSGVSGYKEHRYAWTNSTDRPSAGWSTWNTSPTPTITQSGEGVWYLHVEVQDRAGNVGYQYAGTYKVDTSAPVLDMDFTEIEDEQIYSSMGTNKVNFTGKVTENNLTSRVEVYYAIENESTGVKVTTSDVLLLDKADNVHESPFAGTYRIDPSMKNGVYTLLVFAKNHLGLTSTKSVTFEVANPTSKPSVNIMIHPQPTGTWVNSYIDTYTTDSGDISLLAGAEKKYEVTNSPVYPSTFTRELPADRKVTLQQVGINYLHVQYTLEDGTVISSTAGPYLLDTGAVGDFATTLEDNAGIPVNGWTNKELFLVISDPVTTPISGMTKQYRVENYHTEWQTYTGKTKITTEGDARIFARILTKAGTPSDQQVVRAQVDRSLPLVRSMQLDVTKDNLYHVLVRTTDELSGVVEVKTDVQPLPNTASDQYKLGGIGSKPTSVTITDKAGNVVAGIPFAAEPGVAFDAPYSLSAPVYREDVFARLTGDHDISYKIGNKQMICTANPCPITISQNNTLTAIHTEGNKQTTKVYAIQNIHKEKLNLVLQAQRDKMDPSSIKFSWNYTIASGNLHCIESGNALTYTVAGTSNTQTGKNYLYDCRLVATYGGEVLTSNRILLYPDKTHPLDADGDTNLTKVETNIYIEESRVGTSYFINAKSNNFKYEKIPLPLNDITK